MKHRRIEAELPRDLQESDWRILEDWRDGKFFAVSPNRGCTVSLDTIPALYPIMRDMERFTRWMERKQQERQDEANKARAGHEDQDAGWQGK